MSTAALGIGATAASSILGAAGKAKQGGDAYKAGVRQDEELNRVADQTLGAGSREAYEIGRKGEQIKGDATEGVVADGGAADAGSIERLALIETETNYSALSALYDADQEAAQLRAQGREARKAGKNQRTAGYMGAAGSILSGVSSIAGRL